MAARIVENTFRDLPHDDLTEAVTVTVEMPDDVLEVDLCAEHLTTYVRPLAAAGQTTRTP